MEESYATIEIENNHSHVPRDNPSLAIISDPQFTITIRWNITHFSIFLLIDYHDKMEAN